MCPLRHTALAVFSGGYNTPAWLSVTLFFILLAVGYLALAVFNVYYLVPALTDRNLSIAPTIETCSYRHRLL